MQIALLIGVKNHYMLKVYYCRIELGCHDALQRKYLKTIVLAIFEDPARQEIMLETYIIKIAYPC